MEIILKTSQSSVCWGFSYSIFVSDPPMQFSSPILKKKSVWQTAVSYCAKYVPEEWL